MVEYEPAGIILRSIEGRLGQELARTKRDFPLSRTRRGRDQLAGEMRGLEFALELVSKQIIVWPDTNE